MKVLLDENLPHKLRSALASHDVSTAAYMGWAGVKNGELLALAEAAGFQVFLTADRNLAYQQNLSGRVIALVVLTAHTWDRIEPNMARVVAALERAGAGTFEVVDCGRFQR